MPNVEFGTAHVLFLINRALELSPLRLSPPWFSISHSLTMELKRAMLVIAVSIALVSLSLAQGQSPSAAPRRSTNPLTTAAPPSLESSPPSPPPPPPKSSPSTSPSSPPSPPSPVMDYTSPPRPEPTNHASPLASTSSLTSRTTASPPSTPRRTTSARIGRALVTSLGSVLFLVSCVILFFVWRKRRGRMRPSAAAPQSHQSTDGVELSQITFTREQLVQATNGFSESKLLGQGGFGYVHKGVLPDGRNVAIKQLKSGSKQGEREFKAEVKIISRVHHRHLVSLVGHCFSAATRTMMLVYEFVPNNTLEFHLHGISTMDWTTRMKIAVGSAKGLAYLHEDCKPRVIHRDIKAANILLDNDFEPQVADFGLAKFLSDTDTHVSTQPKGTVGYVAPEYANTGKFTEKSDVFSFGVVLLELITGRKPCGTVDWARPLLSRALENGNFEGIADPRLQNNYSLEDMNRMVSCAANCVLHSAEHRPRMSQVVQALQGNIKLENVKEKMTRMSQNSDDLKKWWKMALGGGVGGSNGEYSSGPSHYQ